MKFFLSLLTVLLFCHTATAINLDVQRRDQKLATQQMIEKQSIVNPAAAGSADVLSAHAGATSAAIATASSFVAQPDVPRNLVLTPGGTTNDIESCVVVIAGTNIFGSSMSENFTFSANQTTPVTGSEAFNTVSTVTFPANCESGGFAATWSLGYGEKLGLKRCMDAAGHLLFSTVDGVYESTRATCTADADEVEKNVCDFNGTMDGAADFEVFFIQNFACLP